MTDPEMADAIYIEPVNWRTVARIIEKEKPDALLPTMGGQTALNRALDLVREGVLEKYGVELIAASREAIDMAEDRELFATRCARSGSRRRAPRIARIARRGAGARRGDRLSRRSSGRRSRWAAPAAASPTTARSSRPSSPRGLDASPTGEVLIEESVIGWKEFEMEVVRDRNDNCVIVCSIENFDPMGVHTGDSITVAPALTLTDKEYQRMRDASIAVLRKIGVETGGSNVQFAVSPQRRPAARDRDESARVALVGAGLEGHRFSDREDRGEARGRLHARRAARTTSRAARRRPRSSRRSTTSSPRSRASRSRSFPRPTIASRRR